MDFIKRIQFAAKVALGLYSDVPEPALTMLRNIHPGAVGPGPDRGTTARLESYSTHPWARAAVGHIASSIAGVQWMLYSVGPRNGRAVRDIAIQRAISAQYRKSLLQARYEKGELREISDHLFLDLLNTGNSYHTGFALRKIMQCHLDLAGEFFALKQRNSAGKPVALWPIPPSWVMNLPTPAHSFFRISHRGWQSEIPDTEVFWMTDPDPAKPYARGSGVIGALADELEVDEYSAKTLKQWYMNFARPDILVIAEGARPAETQRLEEEWNNRNQGFWRRWKAMFLNRKVTVEKFEQDFRSLQMIQTREHARDVVTQTFNIPPELLGNLQNSNRATIAASEYLYSRFVLTPRLENIRAAFQEKLIPEYDERLILDYISPVEEDREHQREMIRSTPFAFEVDEIRHMTGLARLPEERGKVFGVPFQIQMVENLREGIAAPLLGEEFRAAKKAVASGDNGTPDDWRKSLIGDAKAFRDAGDADGEKVILRALGEDIEDLPYLSRLAARLKPQFRREFLKAAQEHKRRIDLEALATVILTGNTTAIEEALSISAFSDKLGGLSPILRQGFLQGADVGADSLRRVGITIGLDLINPRAVDWVRAHGAELVAQITEGTRDALRAIIEQTVSGRMEIRQAARAIRSVVGLTENQEMAYWTFYERLISEGVNPDRAMQRAEKYADAQLRLRAETIARFETMQAENRGQQTLWEEAKNQGLIDPDNTVRVWSVSGLDTVCEEICFPMDEQEARLDEPFMTGEGESVMTPPAHPRCVCGIFLEFKSNKSVATRVAEKMETMLEALHAPKVRRVERDPETNLIARIVEEGQ